MKIRSGFVSNSSSSSFIVAFKDVPRCVNEMKQVLFGNAGVYRYGSVSWPAQLIADIVWNDFRRQEPLTEQAAKEDIVGGWVDGQPDYPPSNAWWEKDKLVRDRIESQYYAECETFANDTLERFKEQNDGSCLYLFTYADEDGTQVAAAMEHGTLFDNVPHIKVSHH